MRDLITEVTKLERAEDASMQPTAPDFAIQAFINDDDEFPGPIYEAGKIIRVDFVGGAKSVWNGKLCVSLAEELQRRVDDDPRVKDKKTIEYWEELIWARLEQYFKPWAIAQPRELDDGTYETVEQAVARLAKMVNVRNGGSRRNMRVSYVSFVVLLGFFPGIYT